MTAHSLLSPNLCSLRVQAVTGNAKPEHRMTGPHVQEALWVGAGTEEGEAGRLHGGSRTEERTAGQARNSPMAPVRRWRCL